MTNTTNLNKADASKWEEFKRSCMVDRKTNTFKDPVSLGTCSVEVMYDNDDKKLRLEITPKETDKFNQTSACIIVDIDEDACHVDDVMEMAHNAECVKEAKESSMPIKVYT